MNEESLKVDESEEKLAAWLVERVAEYVGRRPQEIETNVPLSEYGLDSVFALTLTGDLEDYLEIEVEPTVIWDNPTVEKLSKALLGAE